MKHLAFLLAFLSAAFHGVAAPKPVKVFVLAGQSNMEGQAVVDLEGKDYNDGKGTLATLMRDPAKTAMFKHLKNADGQWVVRDDVWVRYQREGAPLLKGPLGFGFSVYGDAHHFGPELQFGHVVGDHFTNQVLLIKTAWGGKSLYKDFRPPSSGGQVGPYYTKMLAEIREALASIKADFPGYAGGYELAGFVWYHGWNDGVSPKVGVPEYETNLVNLIRDVRKELNAPKLPVVIGEITGPWIEAPREWTALRKAQAAAAARLEFAGNVIFIETHDFVRKPEDSPNPSHGHHEFGNAETYFLVGDALGKGMVRLLNQSFRADYSTRVIEGWTVRINGALLQKEKAATEIALSLLQKQLAEIVRIVPAPAVAKLRDVTLWFSPEYPGVKPRAEYHPGAGWLRENGRDPEMVKGVEFTDVRDFKKEMNRMPNFVLHELAHAYHDRVLDRGFDNAEIKAAYERAKASKAYDKVERWFGNGRPNTFERAYAMTSPQEYFAESTEAFFSRNDFFPFTRDELERHDPGMEKLLAQLWKTSAASPARSAAATESQFPVAPAKGDPAMLTLDRIFDSDEFSGEGIGTFVWSKRTAGYFTLETPKVGGSGRDLVRNDPAGGAKEIIVPAQAFVPPGESRPISAEGFEFSSDESKLLLYTNSKRVWRRNSRGDYWVLDVATRELKKLGGNAASSTLMFAKFSPDGRSVGYVRENNLYVQDVRNLSITALTTNGSATLINGTSDWVYEEELDLRDAWRWSPNSQAIAYWQLDVTGVRDFFLINNTDGIYSRPVAIAYPKVGEQNASARVGLISARGGQTRWLDVPGDPRNHYLAVMEWTPDSSQLLLQQFNRLQNTNRVMLADAASGATHDILIETDPAWLENENPVRWMRKGEKFVWLSERSGWRQAYLAGRDGKHFSRITKGDFDVIEIESVDDKNGWLYYAASPDQPTQRYLYRTRLDGGKAERLTPSGQPGWHTYNVSPDSAWAVHTYSTLTTPPVIELTRLPEHKVERVLAANQKLRDNLAKLRRPASEFLRLDIGGKISLDAWCLKPPGLDPAGKYPLVFYVYGEPHGQTVRDAWSGRTGLWHAMLAQEGYVVASVDNRGTMSPRGRGWRKSVYRQIGILAPQEQAAAARVLFQRWPFADTNHVGIWGWSGGGSMSLDAILQFPDLYQTAMAVAPVPNQRLYDSIYQERYMGLPEDNADGYRRGSPLTYASQLKGNLLLVHGTGDDNCHYQGVEMLMNELIAHNKPFTVMPYPNRTHGIFEGRNTTRHLYALLTGYLHQNLPPPALEKSKSSQSN